MAVWVRSATPYAYVTLPGLSSFSVPQPTSYVEGDVLVALARCNLSPLFAASGWTERASSTANGYFHVFTRIATASEPATYTFSNEGVLADCHFVIFCLGGVASSSQVGGAACDYVTETSDPLAITAPAFTSTVSGSAAWLMMHYTDYAGYTFTQPSGYSVGPYDINLAGTYSIIYASALKDGITSGTVAAADGTINVSGTGANFFTVQIGIASGSVDPLSPVFDSAIFDSVVFDTGPSNQTYTLSFDDSITTSDQANSVSLRVRVADDSLTTLDENVFTVVSGSVINAAVLTDALTVIDAFLGSRFLNSTQSESIATTDASIASRLVGSTQSDSIATTDAFLSSRLVDSTQSDSILATDNIAYSLILIKTVEEALTTFDSLTSSITSGGIVNVVALSDLLTISDGPIAYVLSSRLVEDALTTADASLLSRMATAYLQDSLTLSDALTNYAIRTSILFDGISVQDPSLARSILARALLDELVIGDELDILYVPGSSFLYDVRIRIGIAPADIVLGIDLPLELSSKNEFSVGHEDLLQVTAESSLTVGGY